MGMSDPATLKFGELSLVMLFYSTASLVVGYSFVLFGYVVYSCVERTGCFAAAA